MLVSNNLWNKCVPEDLADCDKDWENDGEGPGHTVGTKVDEMLEAIRLFGGVKVPLQPQSPYMHVYCSH